MTSLKQRIIDAHTHVGPCRVYDLNPTWDEILQSMNDNGVQTSIVQPLPGDPDAKETHTKIAELMKEFPGRIFGMADLSPHVGREVYTSEMRRCIEDLGFVGIKMHPPGHAVKLFSQSADLVFKVANELKMPLMIHTGEPAFALPSVYISKAMEYPDLKIILAHAGWGNLAEEHFLAAKICPNIYLETCWICPEALKWYGKDLPMNKMLFGSDVAGNLSIELFKYKNVGFSAEQLDHYLFRNAATIFNLKKLLVA